MWATSREIAAGDIVIVWLVNIRAFDWIKLTKYADERPSSAASNNTWERF